MCPRSALLLLVIGCGASNAAGGVDDDDVATVSIGKCCEPQELLVDDSCTLLTETNETEWRPEFVAERDTTTGRRKFVEPKYELKIGRPKCDSNEHQAHVYSSPKEDGLEFLPTGVLHHYTSHPAAELYSSSDDEEYMTMHRNYPFGDYCVDKAVLTGHKKVSIYAMVCVPNAKHWTDTNYLMKQAIDPAFHAISMACYFVVAIVYFVLPQLRDLVGNIVTSMMLCLVVNQCATTVRVFDLGNHINLMFADIVVHVSLMAAFFWLIALGYYVWNTFRSRNVFLRVTDGRKYCYYSSWVWSLTVCIAATAIFAHYALETNKPTVSGTSYVRQETLGWLGISVMSMCIAFTAIIDLCLVLTTANRIKRMSTYGRIHHKMKYSFRMFILLYAITCVGWLSFLLSLSKYDALAHCHAIVSLLQALFVLYVCVFGQRRVMFLLGKTCNCCDHGENTEGLDWGEEMTAINAGY